MNSGLLIQTQRVLVIFLCSLMVYPAALAQKKKVTQGINGKVLWKAGNLMPGPGIKPSKGSPAVREIYIYELTSDKQTEAAEEGGFYRKINSKLVKKVKSDKKGTFSVLLPPGYYSLFSKEEKGFYANLFDDAMNINPMQVRKGKWDTFEFVIDYQAVY
jgi:hypothetical protein